MTKSAHHARDLRTRTGSDSTKPLSTGEFLQAGDGEKQKRNLEERIEDLVSSYRIAVGRYSGLRQEAAKYRSPRERISFENAIAEARSRVMEINHLISSQRAFLEGLRTIKGNRTVDIYRSCLRRVAGDEVKSAVEAEFDAKMRQWEISQEEVDSVLAEAGARLRERGMGGIHLCPGCNAVIGTGIRSEKTRSAVQSSNDRRRAKTIADIHGREWHRSCARRLLGERK